MEVRNRKEIVVISSLVVIFSSIASGLGILSDFGPGEFLYESIRGKTIEIYGKGIYQHMSSDVAIQGIAQDYVTLFVAVPLVIFSLVGFYRGRTRAVFMLSGTLGYFFVTYLFYLAMGMYNAMFLFYVMLLCLSFFGLYLTLQNLFQIDLAKFFLGRTQYKVAGWFLIINSVLIAFLWLGIILPPLFDGTLYPPELQHYTTLIVQGFDLGLLLPAGFVSGLLLLRRKRQGLIYGTVYMVFLAILMSALSAKIVAIGINGVDIFPVVFIIPSINIVTIFIAIHLIKGIVIQWDHVHP